jgi:hypothetical protein
MLDEKRRKPTARSMRLALEERHHNVYALAIAEGLDERLVLSMHVGSQFQIGWVDSRAALRERVFPVHTAEAPLEEAIPAPIGSENEPTLPNAVRR